MTKTKKIKGGVRYSPLTRNQTMIDFIFNSTFTFLSNSTISCMSVLATLNPEMRILHSDGSVHRVNIDSRFRSCRSNNLNDDVRHFFMKIMLKLMLLLHLLHLQIIIFILI